MPARVFATYVELRVPSEVVPCFLLRRDERDCDTEANDKAKGEDAGVGEEEEEEKEKCNGKRVGVNVCKLAANFEVNRLVSSSRPASSAPSWRKFCCMKEEKESRGLAAGPTDFGGSIAVEMTRKQEDDI